MSVHFQRDLSQLKKDIFSMGAMVSEAVDRALAALFKQDQAIAETVVKEDRAIDLRENTIDEDCLYILALYQPVADDLRLVLAAIKANNDLERIGDHGKSIAKCVLAMDQDREVYLPDSIKDMGKVLPEMVHGCVRALQTGDVELAKRIRKIDDLIDGHFEQSMHSFCDYIERHPHNSRNTVRMISIAKHLERAADLATNICKDVIFLVEGENVRHGGKSDRPRA